MSLRLAASATRRRIPAAHRQGKTPEPKCNRRFRQKFKTRQPIQTRNPSSI